MRQRKIIWTRRTIIPALAFILSASISIKIIISIINKELVESSKITQKTNKDNSNIVQHDIRERRRLTTGITNFMRIRIPPIELIEYLNNLGTQQQHYSQENDNMNELSLLEEQQQSSFIVSATISSSSSSSIGIVTIENNIRGHGIITIKITNLPQCNNKKCTIIIQSNRSTTNCKNIINIDDATTMPSSFATITLNNDNDLSYAISSNEQFNINTQIPIKIGPTDNYSNHVIIIQDEHSIPIACGILNKSSE